MRAKLEKNAAKIIIPAKLPYLASALAFASEISRHAGFDNNSVNQIQVALEEIVTNVMRHGFDAAETGTVEIACEESLTGVNFTVYDRGMPFDPSKLPEYSPEKATLDSGLEGLGTFLAKKNMDEIVYRNLGREGYTITLTKNLKSSHIEKMFEACELEKYKDSPRAAADLKTSNYKIRDFREAEAIEISKCAYKAYGYTYEDYIYYPEKIISYNRSGLMHSLVAATTPEDIVMGHCAVKKNHIDDVTGEIGVAFVKPEYRGHGIFAEMTGALFSKCREIGLAGTFGRAVTSHTISQKMCVNFDMKPCAILLASFPSGTSFKGIAETMPQRESSIVYYYPFTERAPYNVYPPERHRAAIEKIYSRLGICAKAGTSLNAGADGLSENTVSSSSLHNILNSATIEISSYATDTVAFIRYKVKELCVEKVDVIYMHLDLENPLTEKLAEEFENMGFLFAGILPRGLNGRDALILQYLNNIKIDTGRINLFSEDGREILDHIKNSMSSGAN